MGDQHRRPPMVVSAPRRYSRRLSPRQLGTVLDEIVQLVEGTRTLTGLRTAGAELIRRATEEGRDGYPPSTRGVTGSSGNMHPDPVGDLVVSRDAGDPIRVLSIDLCEALLVARDVLRLAHGYWERSTPPPEKTDAPDEVWCVVHFRYGYHVPARVKTKGRCRWCEDWTSAWARDHGGERMDPPEDTVRNLEELRVERELQRRAA